MNKSSKLVLGVGSAIALSSMATGCSNDDGESKVLEANALESNKNTNEKMNDKTKAPKENNKKIVKDSKDSSKVAESEILVEKSVQSKGQGSEVKHEVKNVVAKTTSLKHTKENKQVQTIVNKDTVKKVVRTNDNPPKATVSVQKKMNSNYQLNTGASLVDWMKANDMDSSFINRLSLANKYGISNYTGATSQNMKLMDVLNGTIGENKPVSKPVIKESVKVESPRVEKKKPTIPNKAEQKHDRLEGEKKEEHSVVKDEVIKKPVKENPVEKPSQPTKPVEPVESVNPTEQVKPNKPVQKPVEKPVISTKTTTNTETIAYQTITENDANLEKGKTVIAQSGQTGIKTITYTEIYQDGKLISKEQVSSKITKYPVNKVIKVGTKVASIYVSAPQAHSILGGSGMVQVGAGGYELALAENVDVSVRVGGNHVSSIYFNGEKYIPWKSASQQELIDILGEKEGKEAYGYGQSQATKIEKAVRAAANATYGNGTAKANSLYNEIIKSKSFSRNF